MLANRLVIGQLRRPKAVVIGDHAFRRRGQEGRTLVQNMSNGPDSFEERVTIRVDIQFHIHASRGQFAVALVDCHILRLRDSGGQVLYNLGLDLLFHLR